MNNVMNNVVYESSNLRLNLKVVSKVALETDNGFFTDEAGNMLGKIVKVILRVNLDDTVTVETKYQKVIQHFPGNYTGTGVFNGSAYERE